MQFTSDELEALLKQSGPLWLQGADLSGANLREANLYGTDLTGAELSGAELTWAKHNQNTLWQVGFDPAKAGAILV